MHFINSILQFVPHQYRSGLRQFSYMLLGIVIVVFYAQIAHAQSAGEVSAHSPYTAQTILVAIAGVVIAILFLSHMYLVLSYASKTYGLEEDHVPESDAENKALGFGAVGWIVGSALIIASYGWGWQFLYIGPIVCLLGPFIPMIAMNFDLKQYREILRNRALEQSIPESDSEFIHRP